MLRFPREISERLGIADDSALERELLQERASTLERQGRRLEEALAALRAFDAERSAAPHPGAAARREALVADAGEALWYYVVQREVCGLGGSAALMREWDVPAEVRLRMGVRRARP